MNDKKVEIKDEAYYYDLDDHSLVVSSGEKPGKNRIWLSKSMCKWIADNYIKLLKEE